MYTVFKKICVFYGVASASVVAIGEDSLATRSADGYAPSLSVASSTLTSKWIDGTNYTQIVELLITNNHATNYLTLADELKVTVVSDSLDTVVPGYLSRLAPGQTAVVQVGVQNKDGVAAGADCVATVVAAYGESYGATITSNETLTGECGIGDYTAETTSLSHHWNPDWYNDVKFGIFIHWGLYSAPAFGNTSTYEDYSEWQDITPADADICASCSSDTLTRNPADMMTEQHQPEYRTATYQYHLETYGEDFEYDEFISNFTADGFDPKAWIDLFADAGARYIVPVTKHHDGFALFNFSESVSLRSSVHYGPQRDLIGELLAAAKEYHPEIRRGTYFSLPEWYNPAYIPYAATLSGNYFGANATNPYTGETVPYTGYVEVTDFLSGIQTPQMEALAYTYDTEIMWCDIGGANNMTAFASSWLNWARDQGRQVTFNDRCGIPGDFSTPEYSTNTGTVVAKWETNRGMDPFSFGYNYMTPDSEYLTGADIVTTLVDAVSKNGNFLLDVGPTHNGSIPAIMQQALADAGSWIIPHGESIYGTRFWYSTPGLDNFRYTTTQDAFYIHYTAEPPSTLYINDPVPWLPGDTVTALGGSMNGTVIATERISNGSLVLHLTDDIVAGDQYVWTFKLAYTSDW